MVAVRGRDGEFRAWPLTENWHVDGVLSASLAPGAGADDALARHRAVACARKLAEALDYVGVYSRWSCSAVTASLLANETGAARAQLRATGPSKAARPAQFQNHLRAVLGMPLGDTRMVGYACMLNWIGAMPDADAVLREPGGHWHDYGKEPRAGRKVGHATLRADSTAELAAALARIGAILGRADIVAHAADIG